VSQFFRNFPLVELIVGNSSRRFSGVTSTMLQVLPEQMQRLDLVVMGKHHVPEGTPVMSFWQVARMARKPLVDGRWRVFHARRNDEMIQALLLKHLFRAKIRIVFTSTAQRHHTTFTRWLMRRMDRVISTCQAAASYLQEPPAAIIPHGVDSQRYRPAPNKAAAWKALGIPGRYGIGIFGRVRQQKGVDLLIKAACEVLPQYPDFSLIIVGEITPSHQGFVDGLKEKIRQAELSERVLFLGKQPYQAIPELFRAVSLVAALSRNEGFGLTVLEAMSSASAVLASEAGAWGELVDPGEQGYVVPCGDFEATTKALEKLLSEPARLDEMGWSGRQKVLDHYRVEQEAQRLCDFFIRLMATDSAQ